jgi:metal-responsive CopG/Arc/MetJ family transcriptional regulator
MPTTGKDFSPDLGEQIMVVATEKVRLSLQVSRELNQTLEEIAESTGTNRTDVIRQALALMKVAHSAKKDGRHLGIVNDARKLDTEIVGLI